jgi:hypothetical protein
VKEKPNGYARAKIARVTYQEGMRTLIQTIKDAEHSQRTAKISTGKITRRDTSNRTGLRGDNALESYSGSA